MELNILFPVYNEKLRLEQGICKTVEFMDLWMKGRYELTIVDNASTDDTPKIADDLCRKYEQVHFKRLKEKGAGAAFRAGVADNKAPIVGYMDVDLSTDLRHLKQVWKIFQTRPDVEIVNGSRWNKRSHTSGRKWYRIITSHGLTALLKMSLGLKATDAICGFKFFRQSTVQDLISEAGSAENGWFYIIELMLRAERRGIKVAELPVRWQDDYHSTVNVWQQITNDCIQIVKLRKKFKKEEKAAVKR